VVAAKYLYRSITLEGGEEKQVELPAHVQITNISFGEDLADATGRTVVKLTYSVPHSSEDDDDEDEEDLLPRLTTVLCALTPGKVSQLFAVECAYVY
jgi:FK506-binding nuclear protein